MSYLIYRADGPSGFYIGLTSRTLKQRQYEHFNSAKKNRGCRAFGAAIRKYGDAAFQWSIVLDGLTKNEAEHIEIFLISVLKPRYNIASGGVAGNGGQRARPVVCINTDKTYPSGARACRELGLSVMTVSNICRRGGQTKNGLRFRFADAEEVVRVAHSSEQIAAGKQSRIDKLRARRHPPETIARLKIAAKKRGVSLVTRAAQKAAVERTVICNETGTVFDGVLAAANAHGLPIQTVYSLIYKGHVSRDAFVSFRYM